MKKMPRIIIILFFAHTGPAFGAGISPADLIDEIRRAEQRLELQRTRIDRSAPILGFRAAFPGHQGRVKLAG
jgi:hypothetical protein